MKLPLPLLFLLLLLFDCFTAEESSLIAKWISTIPTSCAVFVVLACAHIPHIAAYPCQTLSKEVKIAKS